MSLLSVRRASAVLAGAALSVGTLVPAVSFAQEEEFPSHACDEFVTAAPYLATDLNENSTAISPIPSADGHVTPIILVHGWTSHGRHNEERESNFSLFVDREANGRGGQLLARDEIKSSLIGKLQQIPGAAVYMFDYHQVSSRWVTDPQIGRKLAKGIECVTQTYGNKAVMIGHSMGGLAIREALSQTDTQGAAVSERVSRAVTFGTPNDGTAIMDFAFKAIDGATLVPGLNIPVGILKLIMSECSKRADATGEFCFGVGGPLDAAYSEGAMAMLPGSAQITRLAKWPESVDYVALAGHIKLGGFTLFGHSSKRLLDLGDMAVDYQSAISGGEDVATAECEYGIVSKAALNDLGLSIAAIFTGDSKRRPTGLLTPFQKGRQMASPCYHNNLMSEVGLVNKALAAISQVASVPQPLPAVAGEAPTPTAPPSDPSTAISPTEPTEPSEPSEVSTPQPAPGEPQPGTGPTTPSTNPPMPGEGSIPGAGDDSGNSGATLTP